MPPAFGISHPMQMRQTLMSSWHNSAAIIDGSRSSPQQ